MKIPQIYINSTKKFPQCRFIKSFPDLHVQVGFVLNISRFPFRKNEGLQSISKVMNPILIVLVRNNLILEHRRNFHCLFPYYYCTINALKIQSKRTNLFSKKIRQILTLSYIYSMAFFLKYFIDYSLIKLHILIRNILPREIFLHTSDYNIFPQIRHIFIHRNRANQSF